MPSSIDPHPIGATNASNVDALAQRAAAVELDVYPHLSIEIVRGEGNYLIDHTGKRYLDLYAGHAVASTGHCHPHVVDAIQRQASQLIFQSNAVYHAARIEAAELLLKHAPISDSKVFFCCSGAEANDTALKLVRTITGRRKVVSFERSFHGRTTATLSAAGMEKYRATAGPVLIEDHVRVPFGDVAALEAAVDEQTAAIFCETIQSLGGIFTASDAFFREMERIACGVGAQLIFDEVQSGFGRTGRYFYGEHMGVKPAVITLAKGIASGIPVGAVVVAPHLAQAVKPGDHGSTYGGGPIPMAAMRATLEVIEHEQLVDNAGQVGARLVELLERVPRVIEVRGRGLLLGVQFDVESKPINRALLEAGFMVGSSGQSHTMRLLPPLTLTEAQAREFVGALTEVCKRLPSETDHE